MSAIFYKVLFKGSDKSTSQLTLTFKNVLYEKPINIPSQYFFTLKNISEINQDIITFQNIQEVIKIGGSSLNLNINYYIILLYTYMNGKKEGLLIGNVKKLGDILIGVWPFNEEPSQYTSEEVLRKLEGLVNKSPEFSNISLIFS